MKKKGKISSWNDDKGFGFIVPLDGGNRTFVHIKAFANRARRPLSAKEG
ncbi:MAG: cold shock domain-containing protein [Candidatus Thiodiazotropha sp. L084R]